MSNKVVVPIVEGHGEITAAPQLLRMLLYHYGSYDVQVTEPIRRHRGELAKCDGLMRWVKVARGTPGCVGVVVIFDEDDDCAGRLGPLLRDCLEGNLGDFPVYVTLASREYEAWLLASMESLKGKAGLVAEPVLPESGPESVRDAKGWIQRNMMPGRTYAPTIDQVRLTAFVDVELAYQHSRSFRHLADSIRELSVRLRIV